MAEIKKSERTIEEVEKGAETPHGIKRKLLEPYYTSEEKKDLKRLTKEIYQLTRNGRITTAEEAEKIFSKYSTFIKENLQGTEHTDPSALSDSEKIQFANSVLSEKAFELLEARRKIGLDVEGRYIIDLAGKSADQIHKDAQKILKEITHDAFVVSADRYSGIAEAFKDTGDEDLYIYAHSKSIKDYRNYFNYILGRVRLQEQALSHLEKPKPEEIKKFYKMIHKMVSKHYERPEEIDIGSPIDEDLLEIFPELKNAISTTYGTLSKDIENMEFPLDKINTEIWREIATGNKEGQLQFLVNTSSREKYIEDCIIVFSIDFNEVEEGLKITKKLTFFDKRVYNACFSLYEAGARITTVEQIHRAMGNKGKTSKNQREKIITSLKKLEGAKLILDTKEENKYYKNYPHYYYYSSLLPLKICLEEVNGVLTGNAIKFLDVPPLGAFAKKRNQITTIPLAVLETPKRQTEISLAIQDYLLERIARIRREADEKKHQKGWDIILHSTLLKECKIEGITKTNRAKDAIETFLSHYTSVGWIKGYTNEKDRIIIRP